MSNVWRLFQGRGGSPKAYAASRALVHRLLTSDIVTLAHPTPLTYNRRLRQMLFMSFLVANLLHSQVHPNGKEQAITFDPVILARYRRIDRAVHALVEDGPQDGDGRGNGSQAIHDHIHSDRQEALPGDRCQWEHLIWDWERRCVSFVRQIWF